MQGPAEDSKVLQKGLGRTQQCLIKSLLRLYQGLPRPVQGCAHTGTQLRSTIFDAELGRATSPDVKKDRHCLGEIVFAGVDAPKTDSPKNETGGLR